MDQFYSSSDSIREERDSAMFKSANETRFGSPVYYQSLPLVYKSSLKSNCWNRTWVRLVRLCCFGILLPIICIVLPVYARYVMFADDAVPLAASDMRLVDTQMSTAWCQAQKLEMNVSFDAFLMDHRPSLTPKAQGLSMIRHFELDDDTKEYWGFYLLKGSEVTVSSCARHLGANVMLIQGFNNLKYCAYVGQESREDESAEIAGLETHKLLEHYEMATEPKNMQPPPMFAQPNKKDKSRILQLLKYRNEKRKFIKLLEKKNIHSDDQSETNGTVAPSIIAQVEDALKKILHQEINSLYQEVKTILSSNVSQGVNTNQQRNQTKKSHKTHWPSKSFDTHNSKLSAVVDEPVDQEEDGAFEMEDSSIQTNVTADGIADDRGTIDHNHVNDTSQSNEESSFSSSEEAMLNCRGVLISQPLVPESRCTNTTDPSHNVINYVVKDDGYYYFIFSSANEKVRNKLTVKFELQKTIFNVTDASSICFNSTVCHFPLNFISDQRVVVSVPSPDSRFSSLWDQTFVAQSVCEPRVPLYLAFCIILPLSIIFCALS